MTQIFVGDSKIEPSMIEIDFDTLVDNQEFIDFTDEQILDIFGQPIDDWVEEFNIFLPEEELNFLGIFDFLNDEDDYWQNPDRIHYNPKEGF